MGFGSSVALSADGTTALIGDPLNYNRASETGGSATVYTLGPSGWSAGTELDPPSSALSFGTSVALSDNGLTAIVGDEQGGASGTGAATVYTFSGSSWSSGTALDPPSGTSAFGRAVALSGAGSTALVGDPGTSGGGAATAYALSGEDWSSGVRLPAPANSTAFGSPVSLNQSGSRSHCRRSDGRNVWDRGGDGIQRERIILVIGYFAECPELGHRIRRFGRPLSDRGRGPRRRPGNLRWWSSLDLPGHWNLVIGHVADRSELGRSFRVVSRPLWSGTDGHRGRSGRWQLLRGSHRV